MNTTNPGQTEHPTNQRFAGFVEWELTRACNMKCAHCYNRPGTVRAHELSTEEALQTAAFLASLGCQSVSLSGGEPTLRKDWPQIARALSSGGVMVQLLSNGLTMDREQARAAREAGVAAVMLGLDGMDSTHDRIRRRPGGFQAVLMAADALRAEGVPFGFTTTLLEPNLIDLEPLAELTTRLGANIWTVWLGIPRHRSDLWLKPGRINRLGSRLRRLRKRCPVLTVGDNLAHLPGSKVLAHRQGCASAAAEGAAVPAAAGPFPFTGCEAGRQVLGLESDGTVTGCLALPASHAVGNIRNQSLMTLWSYARWASLERVARLSEACSACRYVQWCQGGCHATALTRAGVLDNPYCPWKENLKPRHRIAVKAVGWAASLLMASSLAAGCAAPAPPHKPAPQPPPPAAADPVEPLAQPPPTASVSAGDPGAKAVPESEGPPKTRPASAPASRWIPPGCCLMHMRVPGCVCSAPTTAKKK